MEYFWYFVAILFCSLARKGRDGVLFTSDISDIHSFKDYLSLRSGRGLPDFGAGLCIAFYAVLTAAITTIETIYVPFAFDVPTFYLRNYEKK